MNSVKDGTAQLALRDQLIPDYQITKPRGTRKDIVDVAPHVPAAGNVKGTSFGGSASAALGATLPSQGESLSVRPSGTAQDAIHAPCDDRFDALPQEQLRWRASFRRQPGLQMANPGTYIDPIPSMLNYRHGIQTSSGDKAGDCLRNGYSDGLQAFIAEEQEKNYRRSKYEPLGKPFVRGHKLPDSYDDPNFRFGKKSSSSESARDLLYDTPLGETGVSGEPRTLQGGPVADAPPGAGAGFVSEQDVCRQTNRQYNWGNIDPKAYRFGSRPSNSDLNSSQAVRECFEAGDATQANHSTHIASDRVKLFNMTRQSEVGRTKPLTKEVASFVGSKGTFGAPSTRDPWSMKQAIEGSLTAEEQQPDPDLGCAFRRFAHLPAAADIQSPDRVYGVPSMRFDLEEPSRKSVANDINYGTEHSASLLLRPYPYDVPGVTGESFKQPRTAEQLREIFEEAGRRFDDGVYEFLVQATLSRSGVLSVNTMKETIAVHEAQSKAMLNKAVSPQPANSNPTACSSQTVKSFSNSSNPQSKIASLASRYSR